MQLSRVYGLDEDVEASEREANSEPEGLFTGNDLCYSNRTLTKFAGGYHGRREGKVCESRVFMQADAWRKIL